MPLSDSMMVTQLEQTKIGQTGYYLVLAPKERLIVSASDPSRIFEKLPAPGMRPLLDRQLQSNSSVTGVVRNLLGIEILSVSQKMQTTGWVVVGAVPTEEIFTPIARLKKYIYTAALLLSLVIAAVLHLVLARQFAPLYKAREAMQDMTAGKQPLEAIPIARADEIGRLIGSFNALASERNRLELMLKGEVVAHKQAGEALNHALGRLQSLCERMTQVQEEERRRVALQLHEQAAQDLITLKMQLQLMAAQHTDQKAKAQLQDAIAIAGVALGRIRTLSLDLHSPLLETFGLRVALHRHCKEHADQAGWNMHFDAPESLERLHPDVETACFRVVQEALKNVAQHANATEVRVTLLRDDEALHLSVRDNGAGFDAAEIGADAGHASFGLHAMAERARQAGGRMDVRSGRGRGTEIDARFPLRRVPEDVATTLVKPVRTPLVLVERGAPL
jgi:signal transduction histidine kinase